MGPSKAATDVSGGWWWYGGLDRVRRLATENGSPAQEPGPGWAEEGVPLGDSPERRDPGMMRRSFL